MATNYRATASGELPPNGQGIAALEMLNLLEPYNIKKDGGTTRPNICISS
ncbi:MAG: hypothetical protein R3B91_10185 [Planctomycetaceae bacterium]